MTLVHTGFSNSREFQWGDPYANPSTAESVWCFLDEDGYIKTAILSAVEDSKRGVQFPQYSYRGLGGWSSSTGVTDKGKDF